MSRYVLRDLPHREVMALLTGIVAPRPIAFVSTLSAAGEGNLAPFSYFNLGGASPPSVVFSVLLNRHGEEKDTLKNVRETGEYTISVVHQALSERMNLTSQAYPRGVSEFAEAGLTPLPSELVAPPSVAESPIAMECRLHEVVPHGSGPLSARYVIGEVLLVRINAAVLDDAGRIDPDKVGFLARLGGDHYARITGSALFELPRPAATR